ncbi:hypothetical protein [Streptomyces sp. NRRL S-813]|uniref:hypothetical protein n=1 Tax=Streptomyces sp. NRRL S-813 TaxID=1463919 RepID=UPI000AC36D78|nr:hypothetical protein [Streptomyces sp. NRRL S-813]
MPSWIATTSDSPAGRRYAGHPSPVVRARRTRQALAPAHPSDDDCARLMQLPLVPVGVLTICP